MSTIVTIELRDEGAIDPNDTLRLPATRPLIVAEIKRVDIRLNSDVTYDAIIHTPEA